MGFSFVSWIVMMSIFVLSVRFFSSCIFVVSPLMFICIICITQHWISSSTPSSFKSRCKKEETKFAFIHCCFI